ncbi:MAG: hypothetical protein ABW118_16545 [Candidatus Thiodiazotropha sp.]
MDEWNKPSVIVAIVSALTAVLALAVSIISYRLSKKSLSISKRQYQRSTPNVSLYLNEGFTTTSETKEYRYYVFSITATNRSTENNSLVRTEMIVLCSNEEGYISKIIMPHSPSLVDELCMPNLTAFPMKIDLMSGSSESGWLVFKIDRKVLKNKKIDGYKLLFLDSSDNKLELEPIIVREIHRPNEVEKENDRN